jgi:hypothetical protein
MVLVVGELIDIGLKIANRSLEYKDSGTKLDI